MTGDYQFFDFCARNNLVVQHGALYRRLAAGMLVFVCPLYYDEAAAGADNSEYRLNHERTIEMAAGVIGAVLDELGPSRQPLWN